MTDVVDWEEQAVPGGGEPGEREGGIELLKGELGQLGGTCPGWAHAYHHHDPPQGLSHLPGCYPDATV